MDFLNEIDDYDYDFIFKGMNECGRYFHTSHRDARTATLSVKRPTNQLSLMISAFKCLLYSFIKCTTNHLCHFHICQFCIVEKKKRRKNSISSLAPQ